MTLHKLNLQCDKILPNARSNNQTTVIKYVFTFRFSLCHPTLSHSSSWTISRRLLLEYPDVIGGRRALFTGIFREFLGCRTSAPIASPPSRILARNAVPAKQNGPARGHSKHAGGARVKLSGACLGLPPLFHPGPPTTTPGTCITDGATHYALKYRGRP